MYEDIQALKVERRGSILVLTIDNPPMNAVSRRLHTELMLVFQRINHDPQTSVVVITGSGEKAFSAGGDLVAMRARRENNDHALWLTGIREAREIVYAILRLERPLIARINGHAMGFGATLAVLSDLSFMMAQAKIADTHVKVGLSAGDGGALMWPLLMGFTRARRYLMTGDPLTGAQAAEFGLITGACTSFEELDRETYGFAERLASGATLAINVTKVSINLLLRRALEGVVEAHLAAETETFLSRDHLEATQAFAERRDPTFEGR